ncbi:MAG: hypothetical protein J6J42_03375 [Lachnospiraceae bacterium]|nr:hypothetical protein [Lachnospiraceae bacterium]
MKEKIMAKLPFIFSYYTIIVVVTCSYNLLIGNTLIRIGWFLELLACLVVFVLLDHAFGFINFKSNLTCLLAETGAAYILFLVFSFFFHWNGFTPGKLLTSTLLFLIVAVTGITYSNYRHKLRTKELNNLIKKQQH